MKKTLKRLFAKFSKQSRAFRRVYASALRAYKTRRYKRYTKGFPTDEKTLLFQSYMGRGYACSPRGIYEAMLNDPQYDDYTFVWAFRRPRKLQSVPALRRAVLIRYGSWEHLEYFARAKYWVSNSRIPREIVKKPEQVYVQTWHGTPFKRLAHDIEIETKSAMSTNEEFRERFTADAKLFDYLVTQSPFCSERLSAGFGLEKIGREHTVLETGYPRNDFLINHTLWDVRRVKQELGIPDGKKVILYAPTWREDQHVAGKGYVYEVGGEFEALRKHFARDYVVLFRAHYFISNLFNFEQYGGFVRDVSGVGEINDLYIVSDFLITDYSSVFFDYTNLGKPVLFYMYDKKHYAENLRGFSMSFDELPGPCVEDVPSLVGAIQDIGRFDEVYGARYRAFQSRFNALDDGRASGRVIEAFTGKPYQGKPAPTGIVLAKISAETLDYAAVQRLQKARARGKFLIACLPENPTAAQRGLVEALRCVDLVVTGHSPEQMREHIERYKVETVVD